MIVYAHRGANVELPENTLEAFARAVELGVDALETDVHCSKDGVVVVHHDADGRRSASVGEKVADRTLAELLRWNLGFGFRRPDGDGLVDAVFRIPTFDQALEAFPQTRFNVDIKPHDYEVARAVVRVVQRHRAEDRVLLTSFYDEVTSVVRELGYRGATGLGRLSALRVLAAPAKCPRAWLPRGDRLQIPVAALGLRLDREATVRRIQQLGYAVDFWVINDPRAARAIERGGADGVMTDDPNAILRGLGRRIGQAHTE